MYTLFLSEVDGEWCLFCLGGAGEQDLLCLGGERDLEGGGERYLSLLETGGEQDLGGVQSLGGVDAPDLLL